MGKERDVIYFVSTDVNLKELLFCIIEKIDAGKRLEIISEVESNWVEDEMGLLLLETKQTHKLAQNLMSLFTEHEDTSEMIA